MSQSPMRVLLVEDDPRLVEVVSSALAAPGVGLAVDHVTTWRGALARLDRRDIAIVLIDLALVDAPGFAGVAALLAHPAGVPLVVLTDLEDEALALRAVRAGAQDHLVKDQLYDTLLVRTLRYALERHNLRAREAGERSRLERELDALRQSVGSGPAATVTGQHFGVLPLAAAAPAEHERLAEAYGALLDLALEQRGYKVEHDLGGRLRAMADRLGFLNAGPRDVVAIHARALESRSRHGSPQKVQTYLEEARLTVLQLMGHLAAYYRRHALRGSGEAADAANDEPRHTHHGERA